MFGVESKNWSHGFVAYGIDYRWRTCPEHYLEGPSRLVHHRQSEWHLDHSELAPRSGDQFIVSASETVSFQHPRGTKIGFSCTGQIVFVPQVGGSTQVAVVHSHTMGGGNWFQRRYIRRSDQTSQLDEDWIARCRAAVESVSS